MSRLDATGRVTVKPGANVYTVVALIAALASGAALVYTIIQWDYLVR